MDKILEEVIDMFQNIFKKNIKVKAPGDDSKTPITSEKPNLNDTLVEITEEPTLPLEEKQNKDLEALKAFENKIQANTTAPESDEYTTSEIERRKLDALQLDNPFAGK